MEQHLSDLILILELNCRLFREKEAAAKFVAYLTLGEGADIFGKQLTGTSAKKEFSVDESLFASDTAKQGWDTVVELINNGTAGQK